MIYSEKQTHLFNRVAPKYDLMNDLMSAGLHRFWKQKFLTYVAAKPDIKILDVAGGTGDIAFQLCKRFCRMGGEVWILDPSSEMIKKGQSRAIDAGLLEGLHWTLGNGEEIPFPDHTFDLITISFGLRNITGKEQALREFHRVLKPGGQFLCLEFSHPKGVALPFLYDLYSFHIIPLLGQWVANDHAAYQYLVESIRQFPLQEPLKIRIEQAGFDHVFYKNLCRGVVAIHGGWRPV